MVYTTTPRLVSDAEIRASYERDRSIREACGAIRFYSEKLDASTMEVNDETAQSYYVPISVSQRRTYVSTLDHLRVHASALALAYETQDKGQRLTYRIAAEELDRILDRVAESEQVTDEGADKQEVNPAYKRFATSIRNDPRSIQKLLQEVVQDKGIINFWQNHIESQKSGILSNHCAFELEEQVHDHFANKHSIRKIFERESTFEEPTRG